VVIVGRIKMKGEIMKYILIVVFTIILGVMLVVGWVREAQASNNYTQDLEARVAALEEELAFQSGNIEELRPLHWNDPAKVADVVYGKIWERSLSCRDDYCYQADDVLYAFDNVPAQDRDSFLSDLFRTSTWTAADQGDGTWLVVITDKNGNTYNFIADSIYNTICYELSNVCQ
jgi:hypothetical protein